MLEYINKKHPQHVVPQENTKKTQQIAVTDMREKPVDIFIVPLVRL